MSKIHDKLFVRTLYERAIAAHNVDEYLWDSYVSYMVIFGKREGERLGKD